MKRKVLVSIDNTLLRRVDLSARRRGLDRSALISMVLADHVGGRTPADQLRVEAGHARLVQLFEQHDSTGDVVKMLRDERDARA